MYDGITQTLVSNPIDRYLLNTPTEPNWVKNADGGYAFYVQTVSSGKDKETNRLPAPGGPFYTGRQRAAGFLFLLSALRSS